LKPLTHVCTGRQTSGACEKPVGLQERTNNMKKIFRKIIGYMVVLPFVVSSKFLSIFLGQEKAIEVVGTKLTKSAQRSLKFWVPKINDAKDFDSFPAKMKKNFRLWKIFYDIEISEESNDVFKLRVSNCPFCEALNCLGMSTLSPYVCEGDWAIARDNADKWKFERNYQIGTGDNYCDHTYKRI
jgi:hypothetical protein